mmetsp:Transcript_3113/g.8229  ORF Transcript_3113/g.8229 Transcript_3113/m.8229 type:complete len:327 (+) Transcript_3113:367-1347(+)
MAVLWVWGSRWGPPLQGRVRRNQSRRRRRFMMRSSRWICTARATCPSSPCRFASLPRASSSSPWCSLHASPPRQTLPRVLQQRQGWCTQSLLMACSCWPAAASPSNGLKQGTIHSSTSSWGSLCWIRGMLQLQLRPCRMLVMPDCQMEMLQEQQQECKGKGWRRLGMTMMEVLGAVTMVMMAVATTPWTSCMTSADTVVPLLGVMNVVGRREATAMKTCAGLTLRPWSMLRPRRKCSPSWHSGFQGGAPRSTPCSRMRRDAAISTSRCTQSGSSSACRTPLRTTQPRAAVAALSMWRALRLWPRRMCHTRCHAPLLPCCSSSTTGT